MKNISKTIANISQQIIIYGLGILILLMPFHAFFSVYLGSLVNTILCVAGISISQKETSLQG
ncbi:MAG: hypothetical protein NTY56_01200 [Patescibacteria group bacterium]|nr:hypothetical protein [Patescibacteria group bacterium]